MLTEIEELKVNHKAELALRDQNHEMYMGVLRRKNEALEQELKELKAKAEQDELDARRYRFLRMYRVAGRWPDMFPKSTGLSLFSQLACEPDGQAYMLDRLDHLLDKELGIITREQLVNSPGLHCYDKLRDDYDEWKAREVAEVLAQAHGEKK